MATTQSVASAPSGRRAAEPPGTVALPRRAFAEAAPGPRRRTTASVLPALKLRRKPYRSAQRRRMDVARARWSRSAPPESAVRITARGRRGGGPIDRGATLTRQRHSSSEGADCQATHLSGFGAEDEEAREGGGGGHDGGRPRGSPCASGPRVTARAGERGLRRPMACACQHGASAARRRYRGHWRRGRQGLRGRRGRRRWRGQGGNGGCGCDAQRGREPRRLRRRQPLVGLAAVAGSGQPARGRRACGGHLQPADARRWPTRGGEELLAWAALAAWAAAAAASKGPNARPGRGGATATRRRRRRPKRCGRNGPRKCHGRHWRRGQGGRGGRGRGARDDRRAERSRRGVGNALGCAGPQECVTSSWGRQGWEASRWAGQASCRGGRDVRGAGTGVGGRTPQ